MTLGLSTVVAAEGISVNAVRPGSFALTSMKQIRDAVATARCLSTLESMAGPINDVVQLIEQFATRSAWAAEAVREVRRAGHLLRVHSTQHELDERGVGAWHDFAEYLSCVLARPVTENDLLVAGFLVDIPAQNRAILTTALSNLDERYQHFRLTAPDPARYPDLDSYFAAHVAYHNDWRQFVGVNDIFQPIDPNDPDPILDEEDDYWMEADEYSRKLPPIPTEFPPVDGEALNSGQELDVVDVVFAAIKYPMSAEAEGHEQLGRGILHHTSQATASIDTHCNIGSFTIDALNEAWKQGREINAAGIISDGLQRNARAIKHLDFPETVRAGLQDALTTLMTPTQGLGGLENP